MSRQPIALESVEERDQRRLAGFDVGSAVAGGDEPRTFELGLALGALEAVPAAFALAGPL
jgi:hypothetical protein